MSTIVALRGVGAFKDVPSIHAGWSDYVNAKYVAERMHLSVYELLNVYKRLYPYKVNPSIWFLNVNQKLRRWNSDKAFANVDEVVWIPATFALAVVTDYISNMPKLLSMSEDMSSRGWTAMTFNTLYHPIVREAVRKISNWGALRDHAYSQFIRVAPHTCVVVLYDNRKATFQQAYGLTDAYNNLVQNVNARCIVPLEKWDRSRPIPFVVQLDAAA